MLGTKKGCCGLTQQIVKHFTAAHTLHPQEGCWRELGKKSKICGLRKRQFKRTEKKGEITIIIIIIATELDYTKQVMYNTIAQHLQNNAQTANL